MIFRTAEEVEEVRRLYWEEGLNAKQIADRFLCAPCTVYACMIKHGIPRRERGNGSDPELYDVGGRMMSTRQIAEETGCAISLAAGKKFGSTKSILSLVNLGIMAGKSLVLNIKGARNEEAFREISKIIGGATDSNS